MIVNMSQMGFVVFYFNKCDAEMRDESPGYLVIQGTYDSAKTRDKVLAKLGHLTMSMPFALKTIDSQVLAPFHHVSASFSIYITPPGIISDNKYRMHLMMHTGTDIRLGLSVHRPLALSHKCLQHLWRTAWTVTQWISVPVSLSVVF